MQRNRICQRIISLFICLLLVVSVCPSVSAYDGLISTPQELLSSINDARDGDVILVGHIDFTAPQGIFNELMRVQLSKSITIRSGLKDEKAVFTNGSFLLRGSKLSGERLECTFENIVFDGGVDTAALTAADWERPYDEVDQMYTCEVPLKAQYAVSFAGNVTATFFGCVFQNYMYEYGGAIWCRYGDYTNNPYYLDLYGDYSGCKLDVTLNDCQFVSNAAHYAGGAIYLDGNKDNVTFLAKGCRFENNLSGLSDHAGGGGAIYVQHAILELTDCILAGNEGNRDWSLTTEYGDRSRGGAVNINNGELQMVNCAIADNRASVGGGLCITNTPTVLDGCLFTGNRAENAVTSSITGPWASVGIGGAMYVETEGAIPISVYNSAIHGNSALNAYGGVYGFYNEDYAGVLSQGYGKLDFYFCTVAGNTCDTVFDYNDPKAWPWYTHPCDVWSMPYITAFGCIFQEVGYASDFPRQEIPSAENGYNYYGAEGVTYEEGPYLTCRQWSVPTDSARVAMKDRYGSDLTAYFVGCNYDAGLYQPKAPADPPAALEPTEPFSPTEPISTTEPTTPTNLESAPRHSEYVWVVVIIVGVAVLGLLIFLFVRNGRYKAEPEPAQEPTIILTRYTEEQIQQIIQNLPQTQRLTARELEVFQEMLMGKKQSEIAYELGISVPTVKDNARRIYDKLEVQNKKELFIKVNSMI